MDMRIYLAAIAAAVMLMGAGTGVGWAQAKSSTLPPANSMKLSDLLAKVEKRDKFQYVSEVEWSQNGYYDVTYFTSDKAKVELNVDPVSGNPV